MKWTAPPKAATMRQRRFITALVMERAISKEEALALMVERGGNRASSDVFEGSRWLSRVAASEVIEVLLGMAKVR